MRRSIMVCATKQHTGKTSISLGLIEAARKMGRVGYMKPVGQVWTEVPHSSGPPLRVDKDAAVAHRFFGLDDDLAHVSPVVLQRGFTKRFLDGDLPELSEAAVSRRLKDSFNTIAARNDLTIVEGTGHCGVGTVIGWSNARVAAILGCDVVLVANGGVGSTFDELSLNMLACRAEGASVAGIILNKVEPTKVDEITHYISLASARFGWDAPVLACVPYADKLPAKMSADDQAAVRAVVDAYAPHLGGCVTTLFGEAAADRTRARQQLLGQQSGRSATGLQALLDAYVISSKPGTATAASAGVASGMRACHSRHL